MMNLCMIMITLITIFKTYQQFARNVINIIANGGENNFF